MEPLIHRILRRERRTVCPSLCIALLAVALAAPSDAGIFKISHLYSLSDFSGAIPYSAARLYPDASQEELYVDSGGKIRVFNAAGMEIFRFDDDPALGATYGLAVDEKGDILLLSYDFSRPAEGPKYWITRCNYRGEPKERIAISGLPKEYSGFRPNVFCYRGGRFLLVSKSPMQAVETDRNGVFLKGYDFAEMIGIPEKDRPNTEIFGFCVDGEGSMYFTVPVLFQVSKIAADGKVSTFGKAGSAPGMFGVVSGIAVDGDGNLFVSDKRRHMVMVFDPQFRFLQEFGGYGEKKGSLAYPDELSLDRSGRVYVSQMKKRGVSVFQVVPN